MGYHDGYRDLPGVDTGIYATTSNGRILQDCLEKDLIEEIATRAGFSVRYRLVETVSLADYDDPENDYIDFFQPLADALNEGHVDVMIGNFSPFDSRHDMVLFLTTHLDNYDGDGHERAFAVASDNSDLHVQLNAVNEELIDGGFVDDLRDEYGVPE